MAEAKSPPKPRTYTVRSDDHETVTLYRHEDEWRFCTPWTNEFARSIVYIVRAPWKPGHPWTVEEWTQKQGLIGTNMGDTMREAIKHALTTFQFYYPTDFSADPDISLEDHRMQMLKAYQGMGA